MAMHVISRSALRAFWEIHPEAEQPLRDWYSVKNATWATPNDMRETFNSVDLVGRCSVFNVGGNRYRIVAAVHFNSRRVYIRHVLSHREYDREKWKPECEA